MRRALRTATRLVPACLLALLLAAGDCLGDAGRCCAPTPAPAPLSVASPCCGGCAASIERLPFPAALSAPISSLAAASVPATMAREIPRIALVSSVPPGGAASSSPPSIAPLPLRL